MPRSSAAGPHPGHVALRLLQNAGGALRDGLFYPFESRVPREWVGIRLDRGLVELSGQSPFLEEALQLPRVFANVLECAERARRDPQVVGVLLRVGRAPIGWAKLEALARSIGSLRSAGKKVVLYADATGNAGAWLGGLADRFWLAPGGRVDLIGVRAETPFARRLLDRLGVRPDVLSAGRYKSAGELLMRDSMSELAREALEQVVEVLYDSLVAGLAAGRAKNADEARRWIDEGPYLAAEAREIGLVDDLVYADELPTRLAALAREAGGGRGRGDEEARIVGEATYLRISRQRFRWQPLLEGSPQIALVPVLGVIRQRFGQAGAVVSSLRSLARSDRVRAVVLRVDSPGGDPLASDLIWRAVQKVAETKPVVASLGDTAASGGYYAAMGANEILCEGTTLTGSIGVVLLSVAVDEMLDRIGVRFEAIERGRHAGIFDPLRARSEEERELLQRQVVTLYRDFVGKAARARGVSEAELDESAQGRVWAGVQARQRGLVDELGGLDQAVRRARRLAGLGEEEGDLVFATAPTSPLRRLLAREPLDSFATLLDGPQLWCPARIPLR
jgi:protease-4